MKILGIDQSYTSAGYCIINDDAELLEFGIINTSPADGDNFKRARKISNELKKIVDFHSLNIVGLEGLSFNARGNATRDLSGLQFLIVDTIREGTNHFIIAAPLAVKKHAVKKKGKIQKMDLVNNLPNDIKEKFLEKGFKKTKGLTDLSDAYWIASYTLKKVKEYETNSNKE